MADTTPPFNSNPSTTMTEPGHRYMFGCVGCDYVRANRDFGPSHNGSTGCKSGSLASGGTTSHCTCDTCF